MKKKMRQRVVALFMAMLMIVGLIPTDFALVTANAADGDKVYTLNANDLAVSNEVADGTTFGTDNYFTISTASGATKVDENGKTSDAGDTFTKRLKLYKNSSDATKNGRLMFTTTGAATIKVVGMCGGSKDSIDMGVYNASTDVVVGATVTVDGAYTDNIIPEQTFEVTEAGTYYIGSTSIIKGLNLYKVVVTEAAPAPAPSVDKVSVMNANDLAVSNEVADGTTVGTDGYFTISTASGATKVDENGKTSDAGDTFTKRLKLYKNSSDATKNGRLMFTTTGAATIKVVGMCGGSKDSIDMGVYNASTDVVVGATVTVDGAYTDNIIPEQTFEVTEAGTYYIGSTSIIKGLNLYKVTVTEKTGGSTPTPTRKDWAEVAAPVLGTPVVSSNKVTVPFTVVLGDEGADVIKVTMYSGEEAVASVMNIKAAVTSAEFTPTASGDYTFKAIAYRNTAKDDVKESNEVTATYLLPLGAASINSATSQGGGKVKLSWTAVPEATGYKVEYKVAGSDDSTYATAVDNTANTTYVVADLTVDTEYTFKITALRGNVAADKNVTTDATATAESQREWSFSSYGDGSSTSKNTVSGNANEGSVSITSESGKIVPATTDGLAFYYTAIDPKTENFTLSATVNVDYWTLSNAQEGFGLMAADTVGTNGDSTVFWNNSYMATCTKVEYYYDQELQAATDDSTKDKITMKLGIGSQQKTGVTNELLSKFYDKDTETINNNFVTKMTTLDTSCGAFGPGTYNIIGNSTNAATGTVENPLVSIRLTIQKNNTGYFVSYTDPEGNVTTKKYYDTEALSKLDEDHVYVGFFASRHAGITVTDIDFTTISPEEDEAKEEQPIVTVTPNYKVVSASTSNKENYPFTFSSNCNGRLSVTDNNNNLVIDSVVVTGGIPYAQNIDLLLGTNTLTVYFVPEDGYKPSEFEVLSDYEPVSFDYNVTYFFYGESGQVIYVSPDGKSSGNGSMAKPLDIYTAVKYALPGQYIVLMEGTYNLEKTVKVDRGIDGTADNMIYMVADPAAKTRPVLDFGGLCAGMVLAGNYWYYKGFDVTNSADAQKGLQLSGSYCTIDQVDAYHNGNTGIQLSRYLTTDGFNEWPAYNTVLNCTSYGNADAGYEDADGFAAKLTVADGNQFIGCMAYNNADDGWDLFAKVESGNIGVVTLFNCVAYGNGYLEDGTNAGNGNGFKLGGSSMSGYHRLINSVAYDNKAKGIDSNSCPDIQVTNSTSFNNEGCNVAFYTNDAKNTDFEATGLISYREGTNLGENFKFKGSQDTTKVYKTSNYYWDAEKQVSINSDGTDVVYGDRFVSLDTSVAPGRHSDGSLDMHGLLELVGIESVTVMPITVGWNVNDTMGFIINNDLFTNYDGVRYSGAQLINTPSPELDIPGVVVPNVDIKIPKNPKTADTTHIYLFITLSIMSGAALVGLYYYDKKKKAFY